jgi:hypothetical protein
MAMLEKLIGGSIVTAAEGVANIIDRFVETDDEKQAAEIIKARMMMKPSLAQIELNKIEAGHRSIFVAGWRPFIGWVCGFALAWHFILFDLLTWVTVNFFPRVTALPELTGTETLVTVLLSLLGLGAMRTAEKFTGRAK